MKIFSFGSLLIFVFCMFCNSQKGWSAHIVGGDITYTFLGFDADTTEGTYRINVTMYRDTRGLGALFDGEDDTMFGVFRRNGATSWALVENITRLNPTNPLDVPPNDDPCAIEPLDQVGVEQASYIFEVTLPIIDEDYMIAYQRCCRNETISNLILPGETGAVFDVIITAAAQRAGNDSPVFNTFPPIFICAGFPITVDQSVSDANGDEVVYSFCAPFTAGGTLDAEGENAGQVRCCDCVRPSPLICAPPFQNVQFRAPFTQFEPLGGNPAVTIDPLTGIITGTPEVTGQYVVGVCIEEFRNGVSMGKIRRDFQFNVLTCERQVNAALVSDDIRTDDLNTFVINSCGDTSITIMNMSTDENFIKSYDWTFREGLDTIYTSSSTGDSARDASVVFPGLGFYTGEMIVNKGLDCADTAYFEVNMFPAILADFSFDYDTCVAGPVSFTDLSETGGDFITARTWEFEDNGFSDLTNPSYLYSTPGLKNVSLIVEDNNACKDTLSQDISYVPAPAVIIVEPSNFVGCTPAAVFFDNLSTPIDSTYFILWDLGDGSTSSEISPSHTYLEPGNYSVSLDIVSPIGCPISRSFDSWIDVKQSPEADFDCFPEEPTVLNRTVSFTDMTDIAGAWLWDFGGSGTSFDQNPNYTFPDSGLYRVHLTAFHPVTNCPDTISKLIDIRPTVEFHFPNAFTPNSDGSNDLFLGTGYYDGLVDFKFAIYNRWGQLIFETTDAREGWNGKEFNTGKLSPQGVYVYKATYRDPRGNNFSQDGHITLLR